MTSKGRSCCCSAPPQQSTSASLGFKFFLLHFDNHLVTSQSAMDESCHLTSLSLSELNDCMIYPNPFLLYIQMQEVPKAVQNSPT